ncbi:DDE-type integrase/transposase/recombinase [Pseudoclavibacter sp. AY1H1]|uniref:DDE-type integrase/transposase/recombinase n=1 Tax=Pseudoclavibacter sp. AY1H1 TaxID=2080584 RepID=UPI0015E37BD3|nr:DDE-type integrase/transposase/recombinase [Pseudoclavibacter sp. AY1H1]
MPYLAVVRDTCSRRALGRAVGQTLTTDLFERALRMALRGEVPEHVVFRADRGTQYTSEQAYDF